jgi:hypothetical protein
MLVQSFILEASCNGLNFKHTEAHNAKMTIKSCHIGIETEK